MTTHKSFIQITEDDLKKIFVHYHKKKNDIWDIIWTFIKTATFFGALFVFFFGAINFQAYYLKANYFWKIILFGKQPSQISVDRPISLINLNEIKSSTDNDQQKKMIDEFLLKYVPNDTLIVPSLGIKALIIWNSPIDNIINDLKKGVAHYGGTALPGENGNVFITGHSSNYWWDDGKYKQVFALLDNTRIGERIYLTYNNQPFIYSIEESKVVKPSQIEVLNPLDHSVITLMTCTPVGTTLNRRVVQARQIYPNPNIGAQKSAPDLKSLPIIR